MFIGTSRKDMREFPRPGRYQLGLDLFAVQHGETPDSCKSLKGMKGAMEIVDRYATDTYRVVYLAQYGKSVYVLHCFKKKSKQGVKTPRQDMAVIRQRLRLARELAEEREQQ